MRRCHSCVAPIQGVTTQSTWFWSLKFNMETYMSTITNRFFPPYRNRKRRTRVVYPQRHPSVGPSTATTGAHVRGLEDANDRPA